MQAPMAIVSQVRARVVVFLLALFSTASVASAQMLEWSTTFSPASLASILLPQSVVVVPGGTNAQAAARALVEGLRASGRVSLVMDASSLDDVSKLDDAAIIERARSLPTTSVAVVRVLVASGVEGAVVSLYDKSGAARGVWAAPRGAYLAMSAAPPVMVAQPALELAQRPGTVPITLSSTGAPLYLSTKPRGLSLCVTPCTLYLPEGEAMLHVRGVGIPPHKDTFDVPAYGADIRLRAPSRGKYVGTFVLLIAGAVALVSGVVTLAFGEQTHSTPVVNGIGDGFGKGFSDGGGTDHTEIAVGATFMSLGFGMLAGGTALAITNRGGIASSTPH